MGGKRGVYRGNTGKVDSLSKRFSDLIYNVSKLKGQVYGSRKTSAIQTLGWGVKLLHLGCGLSLD